MSETTATLLTGLATIFAVMVAYVLNKRDGVERANQVREELHQRFAATDARISEVKTDIHARITETKSDVIAAIDRLSNDLKSASGQLQARIDGTRESYARELHAAKEEIIRLLPEKAQHGTSASS